MVALIVIHNCAVLGLFALENTLMAEMFGCKNPLPGCMISKEIGGLIASVLVLSPGGYFLHRTESGIRSPTDHVFSDWFNLCAENARSERP